MRHKNEDILALHYRCFFELRDEAWSRIFEIGTSPFVAWENYFGYPFEGFELSRDMLEELKGLPRLHAAACEIEDLSLTRGLPSLEFLDLGHNPLKLSEDERIDGVKSVALSACELGDDGVKYISNCTELLLDRNRLSTVGEVLRQSPALDYLDFSVNRVLSLADIPAHEALTGVNCAVNSMEDASALAGLRHLQEVYLDTNRLENVDFLFELPELKKVSLIRNRFPPGYLEQVVNRLKERNVVIEED